MEQSNLMTRGALVLLSALVVALVSPPPVRAQSKAADPPSATAYFEFIRGRHLESLGQIPQALEAYRLAAQADPKSAAIPAEIGRASCRERVYHPV